MQDGVFIALLLLKLQVPFEKVLHLLRRQRQSDCSLKERADCRAIAQSDLLVQVDVPQVNALRIVGQDTLEDGAAAFGVALVKSPRELV